MRLTPKAPMTTAKTLEEMTLAIEKASNALAGWAEQARLTRELDEKTFRERWETLNSAVVHLADEVPLLLGSGPHIVFDAVRLSDAVVAQFGLLGVAFQTENYTLEDARAELSELVENALYDEDDRQWFLPLDTGGQYVFRTDGDGLVTAVEWHVGGKDSN